MANSIEQTQSTVNPETDAVQEEFSFRKAFAETAAERTALRQDELIHVAFDIPRAIKMVLAAVTRIERFRAEIAQLPLDHAFLARLDVYVHAAGLSHARCNAVHTPPEEWKAKYEDAVAARAALYSDALNLVRHNVLSEDAVREIKNDTGFYNVGFDLMALVNLFRDAKARIAGRTATQPADLDKAERVATQLLELTARRDEYQPTQPTLSEDRLRALSLMVKCYQETRRAIQFVRFHHGDAEQIAPSIYTARSARKRGDSQETPEDDMVEFPAVVAPAVTQTAASQPQTKPKAEYPVVPVGAPGGNPFA